MSFYSLFGDYVTFKVQDVNDNAPTFETSTFSFDIFENAERGAIVGRVEAVDLDRGSAASTVSYTFISDWGMDTFSLDPTSGVITLSGNSLDHEVPSVCHLLFIELIKISNMQSQ